MDARITSSIPSWASALELVARGQADRVEGEGLSGHGLSSLIQQIDGEIEALDQHLAAHRVVEKAVEVWHVLRFELAGRLFVVPTSQLVELAPVPEITAVPGLPPYVRGLAHVRGRILAVVDLSTGEAPSRNMIVVRCDDEWLAGVLIDSSHGITEIAADQIHQGPHSAATLFDTFVLKAFVLGTVPLEGREAAVVDLAALVRARLDPPAEGSQR